jgi:hypothetical protein
MHTNKQMDKQAVVQYVMEHSTARKINEIEVCSYANKYQK